MVTNPARPPGERLTAQAAWSSVSAGYSTFIAEREG
jgi:hypothetical protein